MGCILSLLVEDILGLNTEKKKKKQEGTSLFLSALHEFVSKRESEGCVGGQIDKNVVEEKWKNNNDLSSIPFLFQLAVSKCGGVEE